MILEHLYMRLPYRDSNRSPVPGVEDSRSENQNLGEKILSSFFSILFGLIGA